ncbi:MAG: hypothetical protein DRJ67_01725 [Thermoprotei archaeon]|nr:MAG: hypothetical protein DRJ67_01725 [Thermoprotei archaeon]
MWLYCVLIMSFAALCGDALGLVAKILGLNLRIPYLEQLRFAAIGALIATRSWLIFEEDLTRLLSKIYTLLVVLLAIRPLLSYLLSLSFP